ncbi:hypothetical protein D9M70_352620 [compost metagenome]
MGDFIDVAADAAGPDVIAEVVPMLLRAIEVNSRAHERLPLLKRLCAAAARHGHTDRQIEGAIGRWSLEAPAPRRSFTPQKYDDAATLEELQRAFEAEGANLDHNAPSRFAELADSAPLEQVLPMYERWDSLQSDTRCRFMMVERLVQAGDTVYARRLIQEYEASSDPWSSWSQWMGGGKFRYFHACKLLDGAAVHRAAYESFVDSVAGGEENTLLVLAELDSILPVICAVPDWPAVWSVLAEQMASTREHQLGTPFEVGQELLSDEELLSEVLHFALRLPVAEVQRHAQHCALQLVNQAASGQAVFELTIRRLLAGNFDEPLQALLTLLLLDHDRLAASLDVMVADLVNHRDVAVAEAAALLTQRWGGSVSADVQPLPLFYELELIGALEEDSTLVDKSTGAMRVEDALGWTQMLRPIAQTLAKAADSDELHIRQRAAMFIQDWGGLEAFGLPALKQLEARLRAISMQITYFKPHAWIGVIALRHVAGEMRRAGLLSRRDLPSILELLNAPLPPRPLIYAQVRPRGIRRPLAVRNASWNEAEILWADQVRDDVAPWADRSDEQIVAEVSRFTIIAARRAEHQLYRIRAPRLRADGDAFWDWYQELPAAVWLGQVVPLDDELAPTLVRRLVSSFGMDAPAYPSTLCPNWLRRLQWRAHDENPSVYVDHNSVVVARLTWWRDAGPADIDDDSLWGEGTYLALTAAGLQHFKAVQGDFTIHGFARREVQMHRKDDARIVKIAQHNYPS